jgi:hypothetical protein
LAQPNQDVPTSSQTATDDLRNIETDVPLQDAMNPNISQGHNETKVVAMAIENAPFDMKS